MPILRLLKIEYISPSCVQKGSADLDNKLGTEVGGKIYQKEVFNIYIFVQSDGSCWIHIVSFLWLTICNPDITDIALKLCSRLQCDPFHDTERLSVAGFISTKLPWGGLSLLRKKYYLETHSLEFFEAFSKHRQACRAVRCPLVLAVRAPCTLQHKRWKKFGGTQDKTKTLADEDSH